MGYRVTTLNVNAIEPAGSTLTLGASGDTIVATDSVNVNTVKDIGGEVQADIYVSFTTVESTTWTVPAGITSVDYLVVAGGGSGGGGTDAPYAGAGGGGAGGFKTGTLSVTPSASLTVTVGAGGAAQTGTASTGNDGSDSVFSSITSTGGGGGGALNDTTGNVGGSGGGGAGNKAGGAGTGSEGFAGGDGASTGHGAGGGGGASEVGADGSGSQGGDGGDGLSNSVSGTATMYGGGGGGGGYTTTQSAGGSGGGGAGSKYSAGNTNGVAGTANTGGGGGGGGYINSDGGAGGSGIVLLKYNPGLSTPTTLWESNGSGVLSSVNSGFGDALKLISSQTASDSASLSFTSGITSTYKEYIFKYYNINPATDGVKFTFQGSTDGGSNYNTTITSTYFAAYHYENDTDAAMGYDGGQDQAQGTGYQPLCNDIGNDADQNEAGELYIFNPASTVYVKNFYGKGNECGAGNYTQNQYVGGYFNTTSAINAISFKMSSGNMDGTIMMYGVL